MHELALCASIADTVRDHAAERTVRAVHVRIGHFRQVVPNTLQFCWSIHTDGSDLSGASLLVDYVPAVISCRGCGASTTLREPFMICDCCDGTDVELVAGEELSIEAIDVAEEVR